MLHGRYLIHHPLARSLMRAIDTVLPRSARPDVPASPARVLIAIGGHLGDAIMATSAIAVTHAMLPDAEIGVLVGSWGRTVIDGHPLVRRVHVADHAHFNRGAPERKDRSRGHRATRRAAVRDIRAVGYDVAIDLYPYYPNAAPLLWAADIPVRIGYTSGGFGPLYTHPMEFPDDAEHTVESQARLIANAFGRSLGPAAPAAVSTGNGTHPQVRRLEPQLAGLRYQLPPISAEARVRARTTLANAGVAPGGYIVVHMAAATPEREWTADRWRETLERLAADGRQIVCTGLGGRDAELARTVTTGLASCVNLCGAFSWEELLAVVADAALVVSVDTAIAHVAAALDVPAVTLMAAIARPEHWWAYGPRTTLVTNPMPCAPCFRKGGCEHMSCVRGIRVDEVLHAIARRV